MQGSAIHCVNHPVLLRLSDDIDYEEMEVPQSEAGPLSAHGKHAAVNLLFVVGTVQTKPVCRVLQVERLHDPNFCLDIPECYTVHHHLPVSTHRGQL